MQHKIIFGAYRDWALRVLPRVQNHTRVSEVRHVSSNEELARVVAAEGQNFDFVLLCGWSGQPHASVIDSIPVFSEHPITGNPSLTDVYSLGTPLQAQIQDGIKTVKHRLVKVSFPELELRQYCHEVDMSLAGGMDDILDQMRATAISLYDQFLNDYPAVQWTQWPAVPQEQMRTPRVPSDSRLSKEELSTMSTSKLYDFCRMLEGPYPRAHIEDDDGILTIEKVSYKSKK